MFPLREWGREPGEGLMSEFDSESGRKGFVRDVMRRISSTGLHGADEPDSERERVMRRSIQEEIDDLREATHIETRLDQFPLPG